MVKAYCVKDRKMVDVGDPQQITLKNGRSAMQGSCPECGTKVTRIGGSSGLGDSIGTRPPGRGVYVLAATRYTCPTHHDSTYYPQQAGEKVPNCSCGTPREKG